ncbi:MAG: glycerophosphodiester phosphodiesterase family protein [Shimia sp.]
MPLPPALLSRPYAHRALHGPGRPENSREAVAAAIAPGYGIEIDVQRSADGVPMVFHDYGLERLTGTPGAVQTTDAADLAALPLIGGATGAPTLDEVLVQVAGRVPLLIEVKDQDGAMGPAVGPLEEAVAASVARYDGPLAVMSFNPYAVAALGEAGVAQPLGLTTCAYAAEDWPTLTEARRATLRAMADLDELDVAFVSHRASDLASPRVAEARARGLSVLCWTIRSAAEADAARIHADQITFEGFVPA